MTFNFGNSGPTLAIHNSIQRHDMKFSKKRFIIWVKFIPYDQDKQMIYGIAIFENLLIKSYY